MVIIRFFGALIDEIVLFFSKPLGFGGRFSSGNLLVWALYISIIIVALVSLYNRVFLGKFVKHLLKNNAVDSNSAISPLDAGYKNIFLRYALGKSTVFRKIVVSNEEKDDILAKRYYISDKNYSRAKNLYAQNGANPLFIIFIAVVMLVVVALLYNILPDLVNMTENFLSSFKTHDNIA